MGGEVDAQPITLEEETTIIADVVVTRCLMERLALVSETIGLISSLLVKQTCV